MMTIETKLLVTPDILGADTIFNFDREEVALARVKNSQNLAAISLESRQVRGQVERAGLDSACANALIELIARGDLLDYSLYLCAMHDCWQPKTVMVRHKGLWRSILDKSDLMSLGSPKEVCFERPNSVRYGGLAELNRAQLKWGVTILRKKRASFIIISNRKNVSDAHSLSAMFEAAFPSDNSRSTGINWLSLSLEMCPLSDIIVRLSGFFDDRESFIDLIMLKDCLKLFRL